jgi:hypothetical protein
VSQNRNVSSPKTLFKRATHTSSKQEHF